MKIYIGNRQINDDSFKVIAQPEVLNYLAEDGECETIIIDGILRKNKFQDGVNLLDLVIKKLRIGGNLIIGEIDLDLLVYTYSNNPNLIELNEMVSTVGAFESFWNIDLAKTVITRYNNLSISSSRINGMEFNIEYKRNS